MFDRKTLTIELLRLAILLTAKSETCEAKSGEHKLAGEKDEHARESKRAESGRKYALICQEAARVLSETRKSPTPRQRPARPLDFAEVSAFVLADEKLRIWPKEDLRGWYDHFESNGWLVNGKTPMRDWQAAARNGFRMWKEKHPEKARQGAKPEADGNGSWVPFLKEKGLPTRDFATAPVWMKDDYRTWVASR